MLQDIDQDLNVKSAKLFQNGNAFLGVDILTSVFQFLNTESKGRAAQVCKSWNEIINQKCLWKNVEAKLCAANYSRSTCDIIATRGIKRLYLYNFRRAVTCAFLCKVPNVEHLRLASFDEQFYVSSCFQNLSTLKTVIIEDCYKSSDVILKSFVLNLPFLEELHLLGCKTFTNESFFTLLGMKKLKVLSVGACMFSFSSLFSDVGISYLTGSYSKNEAAMMSLERLYLRQAKHLTNNALKDISLHLVNLVFLDLSECITFSDAGLEHLDRLKKLEYLSLAHCFRITDVGLNHVALLKKLKSLDLTACFQITDRGLILISQLQTLKCLTINFCTRITSTCLKILGQTASLRLNCSKCYIAQRALAS